MPRPLELIDAVLIVLLTPITFYIVTRVPVCAAIIFSSLLITA